MKNRDEQMWFIWQNPNMTTTESFQEYLNEMNSIYKPMTDIYTPSLAEQASVGDDMEKPLKIEHRKELSEGAREVWVFLTAMTVAMSFLFVPLYFGLSDTFILVSVFSGVGALWPMCKIEEHFNKEGK